MPHKAQPTLSRICAILAIVMTISLVIGAIAKSSSLELVAIVAAVALAIVRLPHVQKISRIFALGAAATIIAVLFFAPQDWPTIHRTLVQGTAFSAFLTVLGLIRGPVRASQVIALAAAWLFACPKRMRAAAITWGSQFLSVLFNLGIIAMMHDISRDHTTRAQAAGRHGVNTNNITLLAERGALLTTIWNPIGVGFAIVTASIPALNPVTFLVVAFTAAMLITAGSLLVAPKEDTIETVNTPPVGGGKALCIVLLLVFGLIMATLGLHEFLDIGFLTAACIVLPVMTIVWPWAEPATRTTSSALNDMAEASATMASEATIFLSASVIGGGGALAVDALGIVALLENDTMPALVILLGCLLAVPLSGVMMVPHTITMLLLIQVFGTGPIGTEHPMALAMSFCLGWAFAIAISPISAMSIITGRLTGNSASRVALGLNRSFVFGGLAVSALMVTAIYMVE